MSNPSDEDGTPPGRGGGRARSPYHFPSSSQTTSQASRVAGRARVRPPALDFSNMNLGPPPRAPSTPTTPTTPTFSFRQRGLVTGFPGPSSPTTSSGRLMRDSSTPTSPGFDQSLLIYNDNLPPGKKLEFMRFYGREINKRLELGGRFCLITGDTGSGKSTALVTAYHLFNNRILIEEKKKIFLCQPRRLAALMILARLKIIGAFVSLFSDKWGLKIGDVEENYEKCTCAVGTAGYLYLLLMFKPRAIYSFFAIIVDEVHEMASDTEMLLGALRCAHEIHVNTHGHNQSHGPKFPNIILMSATMNTSIMYNAFRPQSFFDHCTRKIRPSLNDISFHLEAKMNSDFKVKSMDLEDVGKQMNINVTPAITHITDPRAISPQFYDSVIAVLFSIIQCIYSMADFKKYRNGLILVTLPGLGEIDRCVNYFNKNRSKIGLNLNLIPFHGKLTMEELKNAKKQAGHFVENVVNVLLATSITDSSVTLPRCSVVIDSCIIKKPEMEMISGLDCLVRFWTDINLQIQRKGRTGRLMDGLYIRLLPKLFQGGGVGSEICRVNLENHIIRVMKVAQSEMGKKIRGLVTLFFTSFLIFQPPRRHVEACLIALLNKGMIIRKLQRPHPDHFYDAFHLTPLAEVVAELRTNPTQTRQCMMVSSFDSFESLAIIGSEEMERVDLFKDATQSLRVFYFKMAFALNSMSDGVVLSQVFRSWSKSSASKRTDGKNKKWKPWFQYPNISEKYHAMDLANLTNAEYFACRLGVFDKIDDNIYRSLTEYVSQGLNKGQNKSYCAAGDDAERKKVQIRQKQFDVFSILAMTPPEQHFYTTFHDCRDKFIWTDICLLDSLILTPCPPASADIREYGYQLMEVLSLPMNSYPDLMVDRDNDRLIATWYHTHMDPHLGMISTDLRDCLVKANFAFSHSFMYTPNYSNDDSQADDDDDDITLKPSESDEEWMDESVSEKTLTEPPPKIPCRLVKMEENKTFDLKSVWRLMHFVNPNHIGAQVCEDDPKFLAMVDAVWNKRRGFQKLTFSQAQFGVKVFWLDPTKKDLKVPGNNEWNQRWSRAIIAASVNEHHLEALSERRKESLKIRIDVIDHGTNLLVFREDLVFYDEETCNYGIPDVFSGYERKGYRVILSGLQPYKSYHWGWPSWAVSAMNKILMNRNEFGPKFRLDIAHVSEVNRIIVARDLFPLNNNRSFTGWCIEEKMASPLSQGVVMLNRNDYQNGPDFLRRPTDKFILAEYKGKSETFMKRFNKNPKLFASFSFNKCFSPLQVGYRSLIDSIKELRLDIGHSSINAVVLDHRIADLNLTQSNYDPLLVTPMDCSVVRYYDREIFKDVVHFRSHKTNISYPIHGIVPIIEMITYPVVEVMFCTVEGKNRPFATRLYQKDIDNVLMLVGIVMFKVNISQKDMERIMFIRGAISDMHGDPDNLPDSMKLAEKITELIERQRSPLTFETPTDLGPWPHFVFREDAFMIPTLFYTTL